MKLFHFSLPRRYLFCQDSELQSTAVVGEDKELCRRSDALQKYQITASGGSLPFSFFHSSAVESRCLPEKSLPATGKRTGLWWLREEQQF